LDLIKNIKKLQEQVFIGYWKKIQFKSFRTFKALNQQLAQKVYKCVNMFLETGSVLRKKGGRRPTKRSAKNIAEGEIRTIAD
jgi:hypothetical protein